MIGSHDFFDMCAACERGRDHLAHDQRGRVGRPACVSATTRSVSTRRSSSGSTSPPRTPTSASRATGKRRQDERRPTAVAALRARRRARRRLRRACLQQGWRDHRLPAKRPSPPDLEHRQRPPARSRGPPVPPAHLARRRSKPAPAADARRRLPGRPPKLGLGAD